MISVFLKILPFSILTPKISPGPNLPFSIIFFSLILIIPVSEPAYKSFSFVTVYLIGLNPLRSEATMAHSLSVPAIAAGPSQGSIELFKKLNNCKCSFGSTLLFFDHASGISINLAKGAECPDVVSNSKTLSNEAESEFPDGITGFKFSIF